MNDNPMQQHRIIGILGGGQLGRMTIQAAQKLGLRGHVFCSEDHSPAGQVADAVTVAAYHDRSALAAFAEQVDIITYEFENIPLESIDFLAQHRPVRPGRLALEISQNRIREKEFLNHIPGIATAPYRPIETVDALAPALNALGLPAILKSACYGYDGKGQVRIDQAKDLDAAWRQASRDGGAVLEAFVTYQKEISVIVGRGIDGQIRCFEPSHNSHVNHILDISRVPAGLKPSLAEQAADMAEYIAQTLDLVGLLAVEMFVTRDDQLLVNEIAPRPHNSGHWTMDGCKTSQFTQFVLAVTGAPLGDPGRSCDVEMKNLIGEDFSRRDQIVLPNDHIHIYGKSDIRPGRKMGHVNRTRPFGAVGVPFAPAQPLDTKRG